MASRSDPLGDQHAPRPRLSTTPTRPALNIGPDDYGWNYNGIPDSSLLQWFPVVNIGSYTGQSQAAWTVDGNSDYVVLGGEFPTVNGVAQQGLSGSRSTTSRRTSVGPAKISGAPAPSAIAFPAGTVRVAWQAPYDMDNESLTYNVYRSGTATRRSTPRRRIELLELPDAWASSTAAVTPGPTYTYTVKVNDPFGNMLDLGTTNSVTDRARRGQRRTATTSSTTARAAYWRLGEGSGTAVYDYAGFNDATASPA